MRAAMRSTRPLCCVSVRVLRAYIYNALFTTAKPPKIRLSPLYFEWASLSHTCTHAVRITSRSSPLPVSFFPGVTVSFIRASQLTDTALCPFVSLFIPFIPFIPSPSSHLRVLALTSRFSFVPVIDTRVNERDDWVLNKIRLMWRIFILAMLIHECIILVLFYLFTRTGRGKGEGYSIRDLSVQQTFIYSREYLQEY